MVIFCAFAITGCAKREIKNLDSQGKNIICFGDSLTFGYGVNPGEDYPSLLAKMMEIPVINAGIDGDDSVEALKRVESDAAEREPLLVIIEFGGNDFLRKIPQGVTVKNIKEMVQKVQAKGAMAAIMDISSGMLLQEYRSAFAKLAQEEGALFIANIFSGILTNPHLKSDFIHPNAAGYKVIAQRVYRFIIAYLNQNALSRKFAE